MLIGITGTDGAGKGTVVEYLVSRYSFVHYSARAVIIAEIVRRGEDDTSRARLRIIANEMRALYGDDFMVAHNIKKINESHTKHAIIESIRTVAEAKTLKAHGGILLAIDADLQIRFNRVQQRRSETDRVTFEEFVRHEALESHDTDPHGMQKQKVMSLADKHFYNNTDIKTLHDAIDAYMQTQLSGG